MSSCKNIWPDWACQMHLIWAPQEWLSCIATLSQCHDTQHGTHYGIMVLPPFEGISLCAASIASHCSRTCACWLMCTHTRTIDACKHCQTLVYYESSCHRNCNGQVVHHSWLESAAGGCWERSKELQLQAVPKEANAQEAVLAEGPWRQGTVELKRLVCSQAQHSSPAMMQVHKASRPRVMHAIFSPSTTVAMSVREHVSLSSLFCLPQHFHFWAVSCTC